MKKPTTGSDCARATHGNATAAPPTGLMKSRRLIFPPGEGRILTAPMRMLEGLGRCPLWVRNGHPALEPRCLLYPQKADIKQVRLRCPLCANSRDIVATGVIRPVRDIVCLLAYLLSRENHLLEVKGLPRNRFRQARPLSAAP